MKQSMLYLSFYTTASSFPLLVTSSSHTSSLRPSPIYTCLSPNSTWERGADQLGTCPLSMPCKSLSLFLAGKSAHWGIYSVTGDWSTLSRWRDLCGISGSSAQLFLQFGQLGCVCELALVGHARHPVPMGGTSIINEKSTYLNFWLEIH